MLPRLRPVLLAHALLIPCVWPIPAGAADDPGIAQAVQKLSSETLQVREEAFQKLLDLACRDPQAVLSALPLSGDKDLQEQCRLLKRRIPWEARRRLALQATGGDDDAAARAWWKGHQHDNFLPK